MAYFETWVNRDLKKIMTAEDIRGTVFTLDNLGNLIGVRVFSDGQPVELSGSVNGYCILADGTTVPVAGTRSGNTAYIILPQSAYAVPGMIRIAIKLTDDSTITTLAALIGSVALSRTDNIITPSQQIITDWSQQIAAEMQAVEDASAAQDAKINDLKNIMNYENIIKNSNIIDGYRFNSDGNPMAATGYFITQRIQIDYPGEKYYKNSNSEDAYHRYVLCDENNGIISVGTENMIQTTSDTYSIRISGTSAEENSAYLGVYCARDVIARDLSEQAYEKIENQIYGKGYATTRGNLSDGQTLSVRFTNVKKNNIYSFAAKITSFSSLRIGHAVEAYGGSWIEINSSKLIAHYYDTADHTEEYNHGLTISNYIFVQIIVGTGTAKIQIYSNGYEYISPLTTWTGDGLGPTFAESIGSVLTECTFTWSSDDLRKSVWMFGDSYLSMTSANRWCYYLVRDEYIDNILLNAFPGETSLQNLASLQRMLEDYGKPKFIVWCAGMNDGSDSNENTPSSNWMNQINAVLDYCDKLSITPIFATIPTVPGIYHEGKNKWVRNSGYRYIDFAKAVGANSSGVWYSGMLSSDNVHPTETGAKALYYRAILDCPEITYRNK